MEKYYDILGVKYVPPSRSRSSCGSRLLRCASTTGRLALRFLLLVAGPLLLGAGIGRLCDNDNGSSSQTKSNVVVNTDVGPSRSTFSFNTCNDCEKVSGLCLERQNVSRGEYPYTCFKATGYKRTVPVKNKGPVRYARKTKKIKLNRSDCAQLSDGRNVALSYGKYVTMWCQNGKTHRDGGPAIVTASGVKAWVQHNLLHRDGGPALLCDGEKRWYQNGELHRDGGPAIVTGKRGLGDWSWYQHGKLHRLDGPAWYSAGPFGAGVMHYKWYSNGRLNRVKLFKRNCAADQWGDDCPWDSTEQYYDNGIKISEKKMLNVDMAITNEYEAR